MKIRTWIAAASVAAAGAIGGLALTSSAQATTPPVYEVVTTTATGSWVTVTGPFTKAQADAKVLRLFQSKMTICHIMPTSAQCHYKFVEYQIIPA